MPWKRAYDLAVIGAGPAGQAAAELAAHLGRRAIIVEQNRPGGAVTTTGGAPTKTLREAALVPDRLRPGRGLRRPGGDPAGDRPADHRRPDPVGVRPPPAGRRADRFAGLGIDYLHGAARLGSGGAVLRHPARRRLAASWPRARS